MDVDETSIEMLEAEEESDLELSAEETSDDTPHDIAVPAPEVVLRWVGVDGAIAYTSGSTARLEVANESERPLRIELHVGGDPGTSVGTRYDGGSLELAAHTSKAIAIDLQPFLGDAQVYSSSAGVRARYFDAQTGEIVGQSTSLPLFFHAVGDGKVALYDSDVLRDVFHSGDITGVAAHALGGEDSAPTRVVKWAPQPGEEAERHLRARQGDPAPSAGGPQALTDDAGPQAINYPHTLCVRINILTVDSGAVNSQGITEDVWPDADDGILVPALGMRVNIDGVNYDTSASTGCLNFTTTQHTFEATITPFAFFTSDNGSYVRLHDGPNDSQVNYPGSSYSYPMTNVEFIGNWPTFVDVGGANDNQDRLWTGAAAFMMSLSRYNEGLPANTEIHVSPNGVCGQANVQYANDFTNNESYIRMQGYTCAGGSNLRNKFVVAHEYGHALGSQRANSNFTPSSPDHFFLPTTCSFEIASNPYGTDTKEWSSLAAREGWAHFVSARVWNDNAADGILNWGPAYDLERWDPANTVRGFLKNECCPGSPGLNCPDSLDGTGTIGDWMRGFWDLHSHACGDAPTKIEMTDLYSAIVNSAGLANDNVWNKSATAVANLFPACEAAWDDIGCHNGLDQHGGANQYGSCP